ncbi:MAG: Flp family type IVb pilin [Syntrophomonadaceae bacterium]|nr:Flp family type IVb pilin [Syntrophomonadaceae bacterium]
MLKKANALMKDQRGASFLEYVFLAVIILVAGIAIFKNIGGEVGKQSKEIYDDFKR